MHLYICYRHMHVIYIFPQVLMKNLHSSELIILHNCGQLVRELNTVIKDVIKVNLLSSSLNFYTSAEILKYRYGFYLTDCLQSTFYCSNKYRKLKKGKLFKFKRILLLSCSLLTKKSKKKSLYNANLA